MYQKSGEGPMTINAETLFPAATVSCRPTLQQYHRNKQYKEMKNERILWGRP